MDEVRDLMPRVSAAAMRETLYHLASDPLPFRTLNYRLPGHARSTLQEADAYIAGRLGAWGYDVEWEAARVQALRRDFRKPLSAQCSAPQPEDPWYTAHNLYARLPGTELPREQIVVLSHKDSQSWIPSPGANDNAIGTAGNLELARVLAVHRPRRTITFLFCNEEHAPWTSIVAARRLAEEAARVVAAINLDSIGAKADEDRLSGRMTNTTRYCTPEGEALADLMAELNVAYTIGLEQRAFQADRPEDDDGSFVNAGYPAAVMQIGSMPYADPAYHSEGDTAARVDVVNARLTVQLTLAAVLHLDRR